MGLETVVEEIREKGKKECDRIRAESREEMEQILAAANKRVAEIKLAADEEVAKQTTHILSMEATAVNLLVKRELLNTRKTLLDHVYQSTLAELTRFPDSFHREAIIKLINEVHKEIDSGTIYCCARDRDILKKILEENSDFKAYKLGNAVDIEGGIIVKSTDSELQIDYSYRTFLDKVWKSGLKDASDILFA
jgi:V/A-type H+-transporting ATPase subunit E